MSLTLSEGEKYTDHFVSQVSTANVTACSRMLANITYSLMGARTWRKQVPKLLKAIIANKLYSSLSVRLYSPCDLIVSLSAMAVGRVDFIPKFEIIANDDDSGCVHL